MKSVCNQLRSKIDSGFGVLGGIDSMVSKSSASSLFHSAASKILGFDTADVLDDIKNMDTLLPNAIKGLANRSIDEALMTGYLPDDCKKLILGKLGKGTYGKELGGDYPTSSGGAMNDLSNFYDSGISLGDSITKFGTNDKLSKLDQMINCVSNHHSALGSCSPLLATQGYFDKFNGYMDTFGMKDGKLEFDLGNKISEMMPSEIANPMKSLNIKINQNATSLSTQITKTLDNIEKNPETRVPFIEEPWENPDDIEIVSRTGEESVDTDEVSDVDWYEYRIQLCDEGIASNEKYLSQYEHLQVQTIEGSDVYNDLEESIQNTKASIEGYEQQKEELNTLLSEAKGESEDDEPLEDLIQEPAGVDNPTPIITVGAQPMPTEYA